MEKNCAPWAGPHSTERAITITFCPSLFMKIHEALAILLRPNCPLIVSKQAFNHRQFELKFSGLAATDSTSDYR